LNQSNEIEIKNLSSTKQVIKNKKMENQKREKETRIGNKET